MDAGRYRVVETRAGQGETRVNLLIEESADVPEGEVALWFDAHAHPRLRRWLAGRRGGPTK